MRCVVRYTGRGDQLNGVPGQFVKLGGMFTDDLAEALIVGENSGKWPEPTYELVPITVTVSSAGALRVQASEDQVEVVARALERYACAEYGWDDDQHAAWWTDPRNRRRQERRDQARAVLQALAEDAGRTS